MDVEEAVLLLEHTGYDDFNLLEHQIKGRLEAIQVILKENQKLKKQLEEKEKTLLKIDYIHIYLEKKFNWLQKRMFKFLLGVEIEDIRGGINERKFYSNRCH